MQVEQRFAHRNHDQVAPDDRGAGLIPEGDLLADDRVLVDARLDLGRPEDRRIGREAVRPCLAIVRLVHPGGDPGDHVESTNRDHGLEEQELRFGLTRHAHDHVVGLRWEGLLAALALGHGPYVVAGEEPLRIGHVIAPEDARLDVEQFLRHAQVRTQVGRDLVQGPEQRREDAAVGPDDRVGRVGDVEGHRAVVGIHRDLDTVADVVDGPSIQPGVLELRRVERLGVRESIARGVRVLDVDQPPGVGDDNVGILVVLEEGRDAGQSVGEEAVHEQLAVGCHLVADQEVQVTEPQCEEDPRERRVQLDPGRAGPACRRARAAGRLGVTLTGRIVEFVLARTRDDVRRRQLPKVDPRLRDRRGAAG